MFNCYLGNYTFLAAGEILLFATLKTIGLVRSLLILNVHVMAHTTTATSICRKYSWNEESSFSHNCAMQAKPISNLSRKLLLQYLNSSE